MPGLRALAIAAPALALISPPGSSKRPPIGDCAPPKAVSVRWRLRLKHVSGGRQADSEGQRSDRIGSYGARCGCRGLARGRSIPHQRRKSALFADFVGGRPRGAVRQRIARSTRSHQSHVAIPCPDPVGQRSDLHARRSHCGLRCAVGVACGRCSFDDHAAMGGRPRPRRRRCWRSSIDV